METLTKENFWDEIEQKYPKAMAHFKLWIDKYKSEHDWGFLFNESIGFTDRYRDDNGYWTESKKWTKAPKYHDLPVAMQFGIFLEFVANFGKKEALIVGNTELSQPDFRIGVIDSINHLLTLMEAFYDSIR
jgi:hypothetical protein